jgi:DNA (cytosine-5)-methyltransferase 1
VTKLEPQHRRSGRWANDPLALPTVRGDRLTLDQKLASPDPSDQEAVRNWLAADKRPLAVDLFSGAGGLSLGLQEAGFRVVAAADTDEVALETHNANFGGLTYSGDLSDPRGFVSFLRGYGVEQVALVAGGPPCQPFSRAGKPKIRSLVRQGKRRERDERVDLWRSFFEVVAELKPSAVLFENVPDLARWNDGEVLLGILSELRKSGFTPHARILQGFEHGVPQHRARLFVVGLRSGAFRWPNRLPLITLGEAISDLPPVVAGEKERIRAYERPMTPFQRRARRGIPREVADSVFDHVARDTRADDAEAFALLRPGQTYRDLPDHLQRYRSDIFADKYKRLDSAEVCRTITAHIARDGYWYIHPTQTRTLSIREAARVQTFPDWFRFAGHSSAQFRQIGNAVPPALARSIARRVQAAMNDRKTRSVELSKDFAGDLLNWWDIKRRSFPWRDTRDPWLILLAELCLRRTRAPQVAERFKTISEAAPTPHAALGNSSRLRSAMAGLGLDKRTDDVINIARILANEHEGRVPEDEASLRDLPGVGHYIAGAVRCFAFGRPSVLVDTNTRRIAGRVAGRPSTSLREMRLELFRISGSEGPSPRFNLALLDLGALVCRARRPICGQCPVAHHCLTAKKRARGAGVAT